MILEATRAAVEATLRFRGFRRSVRHGVSAIVGGAGPPVVLVHGALSRGVTTFGPLALRLKRDFTVIVPDMPGFGASAGAIPPSDVTVLAAARRLADAIPAFTGGRPFLYAGESLGGWVGLRLALLCPDGLTGLVLGGSAGRWDDIEAARELERLILPRTREDLSELVSRVTGRKALVPRLMAGDLLRSYRADYDALARLARTAESEVLTDAELAGLCVPVHLVWGLKDGLIPPDVGRGLAGAIPGATWTEVPNAAHAVTLQDPGAYERLIRQAASASAGPGSGARC